MASGAVPVGSGKIKGNARPNPFARNLYRLFAFVAVKKTNLYPRPPIGYVHKSAQEGLYDEHPPTVVKQNYSHRNKRYTRLTSVCVNILRFPIESFLVVRMSYDF